jgi:hypothetical protein
MLNKSGAVLAVSMAESYVYRFGLNCSPLCEELITALKKAISRTTRKSLQTPKC